MNPYMLSLVCALSLAACNGRGEAKTGDTCAKDKDCAKGFCVQGLKPPAPQNTKTKQSPVPDTGLCTISCGTSTECPEGWSCGGVTQSGVVICTIGPATPFGH